MLFTNQPEIDSRLTDSAFIFRLFFVSFKSGLLASASLFCMLQNPPLLPSVVLFSVLSQLIIFLVFLLFDLSNIFSGSFVLLVSFGLDHRVLLPTSLSSFFFQESSSVAASE